MRYRVNPESQIIHDRHSDCHHAKNPDFKQVGYREFVMLMKEGFSPCDICFRSDPTYEEEKG